MNCLSITFVKVLENYHWPQVLLCYWGLRTSFVTLIDWLILKISIITPPKEGREISRLKLLKKLFENHRGGISRGFIHQQHHPLDSLD